MSYFRRLDNDRFIATKKVSGAWDPEHQHIAPAMGLLAHVVELDRDRRNRHDLVPARLSYDILGTVPVYAIETRVEILRAGRTIELVEAFLCNEGCEIVRLRVWLLRREQTEPIAGTAFSRLPSPAEMRPWDPTTVWPGGFIASAQVRRDQEEPGRARFWVRTDTELLADEPVSDFARFAGLLDIANGMTVRATPDRIAFPNVDLTAHFFEQPRGDWLGFDTTVSFGTAGLGLTSSVLHDEGGPVGTVEQALTIRPRIEHLG